jgi:mitochondrial chaperone BCS1
MTSWLSKQNTFRKARYLEVSTRRSTGLEGFLVDDDDEAKVDGNDRGLKYVPSAGITYTLWYRRRWMSVTRTKQERNSNDYWSSGTEDKLTIRILTHNRKIVNQLLSEAKKEFDKEQETTVCVYVNDAYVISRLYLDAVF